MTDVEGWLTDDQAALLAEAAAATPPGGQIVEIGSFRGRSTIALARAAPPTTMIVAIDPHAGTDRGPGEIDGYTEAAAADREAFERNLREAGVVTRVRHVSEYSDLAHDCVAGAVHLLFIDGAHRYSPARGDVRDWGAKVVDGGTMVIHDSFSSIGVTTAILRELAFGRRFRYLGRSRSLAMYRADLSPRWTDRAANAVRQLLQLGWFVRNLALKLLLTAGLARALTRFGRAAPDWPY
jgi:Methyltransferase domain